MTPKSKANDADAARLWTGFLLFSTQYTIRIKHDCVRYIRYSHIVIFRQMRQIEIHRTIHTSDKCDVSILFSIHKHTNIIQYIQYIYTHKIARYDAWQSDLCLLRVVRICVRCTWLKTCFILFEAGYIQLKSCSSLFAYVFKTPRTLLISNLPQHSITSARSINLC